MTEPRAEEHRDELTLRGDHTWRAAPGCRIFVADRGAVRFDFPQDWVVIPDSDSIKLYDKAPPNDDCVLAVSYMRLPPMDWEGLPLASLVEAANKGDKRPIYEYGRIREQRKGALAIAWREMCFVDPAGKRDARSRFCLAREGQIQAMITFEFWADNAKKCSQVWDKVLETLRLGEKIEDPTRGPEAP
jgi:hypothetical protein